MFVCLIFFFKLINNLTAFISCHRAHRRFCVRRRFDSQRQSWHVFLKVVMWVMYQDRFKHHCAQSNSKTFFAFFFFIALLIHFALTRCSSEPFAESGRQPGHVEVRLQATRSALELVWIHAIAISKAWLPERGCLGMHASYLFIYFFGVKRKKRQRRLQTHTHTQRVKSHFIQGN